MNSGLAQRVAAGTAGVPAWVTGIRSVGSDFAGVSATTAVTGAEMREDDSSRQRPRLASHVPVLLDEVLKQLKPERGGRFVDATLGASGYAWAILEHGEGVSLLGLDRDPEACRLAREKLERHAGRVWIHHRGFDEIDMVMDSIEWRRCAGIVADLGLSSMQLDDPERGFSFQHEGPLDMRFDPGADTSAADLVNGLEVEALADLIYRYGDERRSRAIARRIVEARPIETTARLREVVRSAFPRPAHRRGQRRLDSATRTFQALRIAVNDELRRLETFIAKAPERLEIGGRLVVVSYHSLEDRIVKWAFKDLVQRDEAFRILTKKPLTASDREVVTNPRSRSAKLRSLERVS